MGQGPKVLSATPISEAGEAGVDLYFKGATAGNGGLIIKAANAGAGADNFDGYEISIDVARKVVNLSRHHHNWKLLKEIPCAVTADRWISLSTKFHGQAIEVFVDENKVIEFDDRDDPLEGGVIGLRDWQRPVRYRNFWIDAGSGRVAAKFESSADPAAEPDVDGVNTWHGAAECTTRRGSSFSEFKVSRSLSSAGKGKRESITPD